jgi:transcriptional regulator with XRE-family HTH domain
MTPIDIGKMVRNARDLKRWSQEDLAREAGNIGQSTVDRIEKGQFKRMPSPLPAICQALGIALPDLDGKPVAQPPILPRKAIMGDRDFPVYASVEGGPGEVIRSAEPIDFIPRPAPVAHVRDAYGMLITGTSMIPEYKPGEMALVNPLLPVISDEVYVFYAEQHGEARATIKHLIRGSHELWHVSQHNPPPRKPKNFTLSRREWRWAHRVFGKHGR